MGLVAFVLASWGLVSLYWLARRLTVSFPGQRDLSRRTALFLVACSVVAIVGGGMYELAQQATSATTVAKEFIEATEDAAATELTEYMDVATLQDLSEGGSSAVKVKALETLLPAGSEEAASVEVLDARRLDEGGRSAEVLVEYMLEGEADSDTLLLQQDEASSRWLFFPDWKVVVQPAQVALTAPFEDARLSVDGVDVSAPLEGSLLLWPSWGAVASEHEVIFPKQGLYAEQRLSTVDGQALAFQPPLGEDVLAQAKLSVSRFWAECLAVRSIAPPNCPQSLPFNEEGISNVRWTAVASPTDDASYEAAAEQSDAMLASGTYNLQCSFRYTSDGATFAYQEGDEGVWALQLKLVGTSFVTTLVAQE